SSASVAGARRRPVRLREAIASVGHAERAVALRRNLEVIRLAIVLGRRGSLLPLRRRRRQWRNRHCLQWLVEAVRDEHPRDGVFLTAKLREVNLPDILDAWSGEKDLHGVWLRAFSRAVVGDDHTGVDRIH